MDSLPHNSNFHINLSCLPSPTHTIRTLQPQMSHTADAFPPVERRLSLICPLNGSWLSILSDFVIETWSQTGA